MMIKLSTGQKDINALRSCGVPSGALRQQEKVAKKKFICRILKTQRQDMFKYNGIFKANLLWYTKATMEFVEYILAMAVQWNL